MVKRDGAEYEVDAEDGPTTVTPRIFDASPGARFFEVMAVAVRVARALLYR